MITGKLLCKDRVYNAKPDTCKLNSSLEVLKQDFFCRTRRVIYLGGYSVDTCPELFEISRANWSLKWSTSWVSLKQFFFSLCPKLSRGKSSASTDVLAVQIKFTTQVCDRTCLVWRRVSEFIMHLLIGSNSGSASQRRCS